MDMTTKARIKVMRGIDAADTILDAMIDQIIVNVSARFEAALGRHVLDSDYTETYEIPKAGKVVWLRAYPVDSITSIIYSSKPNDATATLLTADDEYYLDSEAGIIRLRLSNTPYDPGYLAVVYNGGMALTTTAFIAEFPDIAAVCDQQVIHELNRRNTPGQNIETRDGKSAFGEGEINLLRGVREVLGMYSRTVL